MIGNINSIETLGLVDGPGVRYVIFLQGCLMRCNFCHNPETWATSKNKEMTVDELINDIKKYKAYFGEFGGVTVSGGEPLLQAGFVYELFKACKKEDIHTCLDTSGYGDNYTDLLSVTDLVMLSIKGLSNEDYIKTCTKSNDKTNAFLKTCQILNKKLWLRYVILEDVNDKESDILLFKDFIKDIKNVDKVELLPYQTLGVSKYEQLKIPYMLKNKKVTSDAKIKELYQILSR